MTAGRTTRSHGTVLWVNHFAVVPAMGGGTRHVEMSRELVRRGWRVTVAASDFHIHQRAYLRRSSVSDREVHRESVDGVDIVWLWAAPYTSNDFRRVTNWLTFARSLLGLDVAGIKPRIVIGSSPHLFAAFAAWMVARRERVPFVLEVRDLWPESLAVAGRRRGPGYFAFWMLARFLYRVADRIIVLAEGVGSYLEKTGIPRRKLVFVPNGVDAGAFAALSQPAARDSLRLVYAGAHGPANGLDAVLDAAELLRDEGSVTFVLVGDGPAKASLRADAERRQLRNVEFVDSIPKAEMPGFLSGCDAGLMVLKDVPLFAFGVSPNKLFDYWAAALPVVCNVPGEVASTLTDAAGGVQASDSSGAALGAAIRDLLKRTPGERRAMGENGRAWVTLERDRPVLAERLDGTLRSLVEVGA